MTAGDGVGWGWVGWGEGGGRGSHRSASETLPSRPCTVHALSLIALMLASMIVWLISAEKAFQLRQPWGGVRAMPFQPGGKAAVRPALGVGARSRQSSSAAEGSLGISRSHRGPCGPL